MKLRAAVVTTLVLAGVAAGCAGTPQGHAAKAAQTPTPSPATSPTSQAVPVTAPARTPLGTGERVWAAFSQRGTSYDAWWARLGPLLSDSARAVYVYDDPANIPAMKLTGSIHLAAKAPGERRYTAEVVVPTSKGIFGLDLERHTLTSRWLLYAIRFPAGVH
jgi:hypothetical protein